MFETTLGNGINPLKLSYNAFINPDACQDKLVDEYAGTAIDETFEFQIEVRGDQTNCNEAVLTATMGSRRFRVVLMYSPKDLPYK